MPDTHYSINSFKQAIIDPSLGLILISNLISITLAIIEEWSNEQILWIYWGQNIAIGFFNVVRMANLEKFSTKNFTMGNQPIPETRKGKQEVIIFFILHYGLFHLGYAFFLWKDFPLNDLSGEYLIWLIVLILSFTGSHGFSYHYNNKHDFKHQKPNIGTLMMYPYLRILPMHIIIVLGPILAGSMSLLFFLLMKTIADCGMHLIEHYMFRRKNITY